MSFAILFIGVIFFFNLLFVFWRKQLKLSYKKMNKTNIRLITVAALAALTLSACDKSKAQVDSKEEQATSTASSLKIAYVEVDSIMAQYKFCKEYSLILQKKGQNIQNTLAGKQRQIEQAAANFQQKLQQNAYTREQAESIQAGLK